MTLAEYLAEAKLSVPAMAKALGIHRTTLNKIVRGDRCASTPLQRKIHEFTKGKVTPTDLAFAHQAPRPKSGHSKRGSRRPAAQKPKPRLKPRPQLGAAG